MNKILTVFVVPGVCVSICVQYRYIWAHLCVLCLSVYLCLLTYFYDRRSQSQGGCGERNTWVFKDLKIIWHTHLWNFLCSIYKCLIVITTTICGRYYFHLNEDSLLNFYYARPFIRTISLKFHSNLPFTDKKLEVQKNWFIGIGHTAC